MTIQNIPSFACPLPPQGYTTSPNIANATLDAVNDALGNVFQVAKSGTIDKIAFYNGTLSGPSGSFDFDIRLETVNTSTGLPSGTLFATNTNASLNLSVTADNQWNVVTLTSGATVTAGQYIAVVVRLTAINGAATTVIIGRFADGRVDNTYGTEDLTGAGWAKNSASSTYNIVPVYSDGSYSAIHGLWLAQTINTRTFNSGSSPNKRGMKFQIGVPMRICGCWLWIDLDADFVIKLYSSDGSTVLAQKTVLSSVDNTTTAAIYYFLFDGTEVSPGHYDLSANTNYYISIEPSSVTDITIYDADYLNNEMLDSIGGGKNWYLSTNSGSWSDTNTNRPFMGLLFNGFDNGVGSTTSSIGPFAWID